MKFKFILSFLLLLHVMNIHSQNLDNNLKNVVEQYANEYIKPLNNAMGVNINSGLFHNPPPSTRTGGNNFNIYIGVKVFGTFLKDSDKSFDLQYIDTVETIIGKRAAVFTVVNAPTFFGSRNVPTATTVVDGITYTRRTIGGIYQTSIAPFATPHIEVGSFYGTDLMIRILPSIKWSNYGDVSFIGGGIRHNISQHFPASIGFDIAIQGAIQNFKLSDNGNDITNSTALVLNLQTFKSFSLVTVYGALQYENFSTDITYDHINTDGTITHIDFSLKGDNYFRGIAGIKIGTGILNFNADINIGKRIVISSGLGISL